jgi:hypothetical protein
MARYVVLFVLKDDALARFFETHELIVADALVEILRWAKPVRTSYRAPGQAQV